MSAHVFTANMTATWSCSASGSPAALGIAAGLALVGREAYRATNR